MRIVTILGMLVSAFLPAHTIFAATNTVQRLSVSLIGYAEAESVVTTNSTGTVNNFRQEVIRFRISTRDVISDIGEAMGQTFSPRATMYLDDESRIVIVDNQTETVVPTDKASAQLNWDAVASQIVAQSINNQAVQRLTVGTTEYSTCTLTLNVGVKSYILKGFSIGSNRVADDYARSSSYEMWMESVRVIGEADLGSGVADKPLTGTFHIYSRTIQTP